LDKSENINEEKIENFDDVDFQSSHFEKLRIMNVLSEQSKNQRCINELHSRLDFSDAPSYLPQQSKIPTDILKCLYQH
jgi:hypothetical protein